MAVRTLASLNAGRSPRTVLSRILSPKAVMQIRARFTEVAEQMVDRCVEKGSICGIHDLAQIYPLKVFPDAAGSPASKAFSEMSLRISFS